MRLCRRQQRRERAGTQAGVVGEQQQQLAIALQLALDAEVHPGGVAEVVAGAQQLAAGRHGRVRFAGSGRVVDDEDALGRQALGGERGEQRLVLAAPAVAEHDRAQLGAHAGLATESRGRRGGNSSRLGR
jgi:hypothetical protein